MTYWMNVIRGEWGFVENPKAQEDKESALDNLTLACEGGPAAARPITSQDGSVAWLLDRDSFLALFDHLEHQACILAYSPVSPF